MFKHTYFYVNTNILIMQLIAIGLAGFYGYTVRERHLDTGNQSFNIISNDIENFYSKFGAR